VCTPLRKSANGQNLSERSVKNYFFGGGGQCALLPKNPPMGKTSWKEGLYVIFKQYNICSFRILFLTVKSFRNI
jgi:hypothetical protein